MASINYAAREINVKIVYYGPGLSGKTTNLQVIHRKVPPEFKSDMVSLATETDRTLFFDFLPLDLGKIKGFSTKFQLYTVPGQVYYNATRKLVLRGVDGIVFVADSGQDKIEENIESFQNLEDNLSEYGYKRENIPTMIQYNKRDLPNALSIEDMHQYVNKYSLPWSEAVANKGVGVFDSLKLIGKIVIDYLNKKYSRGGNAGARSGSQQAQRPTPPQGMRYTPTTPVAPQQRAPQQPSMYNQLGNAPQPMQQPGYPNNQPQAFQQPPSYQQPQQSRQPIVPPSHINTPGQAPGIQQHIPQQTYQPRPRYQPTAAAPPQMPPPRYQHPAQQQRQQQPPVANMMPAPQEQSRNDEISFEPPSSPAQGEQQTAQQNDLYNYGSISLEPMNQQPQSIPPPPAQAPVPRSQQHTSPGSVDFNVSGKTDLDLEIERYQREIEDKQRRMRGAPSTPQQQPSPQQPQQPQQPAAPTYQQPPSSSHEDYEVYNMDVHSYGNGTEPQQPQQQPQQQQNALGTEEEEMFFTSVDREHQKKTAKRPVNPRTSMQQSQQQQEKGFLSKFFKKDMP